jgi:hypothetical protein
MLPIETVKEFLDGHVFGKPEGVTRAFLLLSYHPSEQMCPYVELSLGEPS